MSKNSAGLLTGDTILNPSTVKGGTLRIAAQGDVDSLDPAETYYAPSWDLQRLFERTMLMYPAEPGPGSLTPTPDIATSVPQGQNNDTVWTYHLKKDIKFSDGTPVTSADMKYAIERIFATDVISGGPTYELCLLTTCDSQGNSPYPGPYKSKAGLSSITTPDPYTITFHLVKPFADWNYVMTLPDTAPVEQAKDTGKNYRNDPLSTGPYMIATYQPNKLIKFVRNPYWTDDTNRKALPNQIVMTEGLSADSEDSQVIANQSDVEYEGVSVQTAAQDQILTNPALKARSQNPVTPFMFYLTLQTNVPPLDNVHCRRAVAYAVNKQSYLLAAGGPIAGGQIATSLLPPSVLGHTNHDIYPSGPGNAGNVAMAKKELAECGHPNGFSTNLGTVNKGRGPAEATAVQTALQAVGIKTTIQPKDEATYYSSYLGSPASTKANSIGIAEAAWGPDWPAPYAFFYSIADGQAIKASGNSDYALENDPIVNDLINNKLTTATSQSQVAQYAGQIDDQVMKDAVMVPMYYQKALLIYSSRLTNVYVDQGIGSLADFVSMGVGG